MIYKQEFVTMLKIIFLEPVIVAVFVLIALFLYLMYYSNRKILRKILSNSRELKLEIINSVAPKFIELSIDVQEAVDLAVEVWRMQQKFEKFKNDLPEGYTKPVSLSIEKMKKYLKANDIEIIDFTGQPYNEGLNIEVLSNESSSSTNQLIIKETIEPSIMLRGGLIKRAKVVVSNN